MTEHTFAVFQQQGGALVALPVNEATSSHSRKVSPTFRSLGRAIVERQQLERITKQGGSDAS